MVLMASGIPHFGTDWALIPAPSNIADREGPTMQDRYIGDVGDFGKYGLLRSLCRGDKHDPAFRLGVLWYRFDGDESTAANDGRHIDYLCAPSRHERFLRRCDPDLFEKMLYLVKSDRSIAAVEANHVLPADTVFFSDGLSSRRHQGENETGSGTGGSTLACAGSGRLRSYSSIPTTASRCPAAAR